MIHVLFCVQKSRFQEFLPLRNIKNISKTLWLKCRRDARFRDVFYNNRFGGRESVSGPGSSLEQTRIVRQELPKLIDELQIDTFLDAPCGDFNWMKEVELGVKKYIGADIVKDLIENNRKVYENEIRKFIVLDIVKDHIPVVDLIFCRDCFVHLTFKEITRSLRNIIRSKSKWLLTTTFVNLNSNEELSTGWRAVNFQVPPFNFPPPVMIINEKCTEQDGKYFDKSLGLWKINDIL